MRLAFKDNEFAGELLLIFDDKSFDRSFFIRDRQRLYLTIAWNTGVKQKVTIDEIEYEFPENSILPLMVNQSFRFKKPADIVAWQFNRDFYCIVDHDKEVGCVGFLFYGSSNAMFLQLGEEDARKIKMLLEVFKDELGSDDSNKSVMLRMLLVRLIIIITRIAKSKYLETERFEDNKFDIIRRFNLLVENHYRTEHEVKFYAAELNKSPKTLANYFALYGHKTPLQIIQERITLEAKRLLYYTDKTSKEIAYDLGFDDPAHFSRFFKNQTAASPSKFKKSINFSK